MNTLIDANLEEPYFRTWRQGDVILNPGDIRLVFQADLNDPATSTTRAAAAGGDAQGIEVIEADVPGFAVLTQSCDLAQAPDRRPFVILAALEEKDANSYAQIVKYRQPRYVALPGLANRRLVVDLSAVVTIEKPLLARFEPVRGLLTEEQRQLFGRQIARNFARSALPDDFVAAIDDLRDHLLKLAKKSTSEAIHLELVDEIRVLNEQPWENESVQTIFYFIKSVDPEKPDWSIHTENWMEQFKASSRYPRPFVLVATLKKLTADEYTRSYRLDLEAASPPSS